MSVKIQVSTKAIIDNLIVLNHPFDIKDIFQKEKPFYQGAILMGDDAIIHFENKNLEWLFDVEFEDVTRSFAITKDCTISPRNPQNQEWWMQGGEDGGSIIIKIALSAFKYIQGKAYRNRKKLFCTKDYVARIHEYEPIAINQPIKIEDGIQIIFSNNTDETRDYVRHIESWGVRGHERHLKNGKVVFVKPYVKGEGKIKETIYEIGG